MNRNRNLRRNVNSDKIKPLKKKSISSEFRNFGIIANLVTEVEDLFDKAKEKPLKAMLSILATLSSLVGFSRLYMGLTSGNSNSYNQPSRDSFGLIDSLLAFFPGRIIAFLILTMSLGWIISLIGIWLTRKSEDTYAVIAHLITTFGAIFMVLYINAIFENDILRAPFLTLVIAIIGVTLAIFIAKTNFRQSFDSNLEIVSVRAALLMNFSCVISALVVFTQITGLN